MDYDSYSFINSEKEKQYNINYIKYIFLSILRRL